MDKYTAVDLVIHAAERQPIEFSDTFGELMNDKISSAIENRKQEIAGSMFDQDEEPSEEE